jgi:hypothetical protein
LGTAWVIALILFSYLAIFVYLISRGRGTAARNAEQSKESRDKLRQIVGFSIADEIAKLDALKKSGSITDAEFARLCARLSSRLTARLRTTRPAIRARPRL